MNETFMKEKPILPLIASMSLPAVISMVVNSLYNIVDSFFVAMISEEALTAVSLVYPMQNFINAVSIGFGVGLNAVISICLGAGQRDTAHMAATHGMVFSVLHGLILTAAAILLLPGFLHLFTSDAGVISSGVTYGYIVFGFSTILTISLAYEKMFQAVGRMNVTMVSLICGCLTNIIGDPILIFGWGPIPAMGIAGAAWATGLGQTVCLFVYLFVCRRRPLQVRLSSAYLTWNVPLDKRLYGIGIPAILNMALPSLLVAALNAMLAVYSPMYVVILGIYYKLQTFLYMPSNGIIQGVRPLIGYNFGAGEFRRVGKFYKATLVLNGLIMAGGMAVCLAVPEVLMGWFSKSPETIAAGAKALQIISCGFLVSALSVTSCGALEGLGKGVPSLWISLLRYVLLIIPAAFVFSRFLGPDGIWHSFWIAEGVTAVFAYWIYRSTAARAMGGKA